MPDPTINSANTTVSDEYIESILSEGPEGIGIGLKTFLMARELKHLRRSEKEILRAITIASIQRAVAAEFGLSVAQLKAKSNSRPVVIPRQISMYLSREFTDASLPAIGLQHGGKHHTTVLHSIMKIDRKKDADTDLRCVLVRLRKALQTEVIPSSEAK